MHIAGPNGVRATFTLAELLPELFGPEHLAVLRRRSHFPPRRLRGIADCEVHRLMTQIAITTGSLWPRIHAVVVLR